VSLSVLYLLLGRRLDLPLYGVGTPGHFLVGFLEPRGTTFYIDPFHRGRLLTAPDVRKMLVRGGYEFRSEYLDRTGPREILVRMMRNLIAVYHRMGAVERAQMMNTLADILARKPRA
jgi:regulator of sirC expression with transglutaminase-like and TPR domain